MQKTMIKHQRLAENRFTLITESTAMDQIEKTSPILVGFDIFEKNTDFFTESFSFLGIRIPTDFDIDSHFDKIKQAEMINIHFDAFSDGRGFSIAQMLRARGFDKEIRASGEIYPDQLFYLSRCGFDSFEFESEYQNQEGLILLNSFTTSYQGAADGSLPVYAR